MTVQAPTAPRQVEHRGCGRILPEPHAGISSSLDATLSVVMSAMDDANERDDVAARNAMYAFINAVEAQRGRKLAAEQADRLIQLAEAILDGL